ncbi:MAG: phospholipid carrier-dependent glycosyltransferase [Vicingaceae bacterium]
MQTINSKHINWLLVLLGAVLFIPFLGNVHLFDWDEINFAEAAREMIVTGNYSTVQINFEPFWEKPPLFFWLQVISMKIFGVNEFAARFPNAICGIVSLLVLFKVGKKLVDEKFGLIWSLTYAASLLPHFYFKSGIIDPWFNLFIFLGCYFLIKVHLSEDKAISNSLFSGLFTGLAVMTKGPVGFLIVALLFGFYQLFTKFKNFPKFKYILTFFISFIITGSIWFVIEYLNGRWDIIMDFIQYQIRLFKTQDAGHGGPFYYHFVVLLIGCFPASVFAIKAFNKNVQLSNHNSSFKFWMILLFFIILILFSIVKTKIVHYSSMAYFPITFLATVRFYEIFTKKSAWTLLEKILFLFIGSLLSVAFVLTPLIEKFKPYLLKNNLIKDEFAMANLQASSNWMGWEWLIGLLFLVMMITTYFASKKKSNIFFIILIISCLITFNLTVTLITPNIEPYSQGAAIEFYKSKANEKCYITPYGFKSYAYLFYANKQKPDNPKHTDQSWLLTGATDLPVYVVSKNIKKNEFLERYPNFNVMYEKNGYVFYKKITK